MSAGVPPRKRGQGAGSLTEAGPDTKPAAPLPQKLKLPYKP